MIMITRYIDNLMQEFGFATNMDFLTSTFGFCCKKPIMLFSVSLATIGTLVENYVGLSPVVYIAFVLLLFLEFFTGIRASIKEGNKIYSKKFGRVILKLAVYTVLIGIINVFRTRFEVPELFGAELNLYSFIYYTVINLIVCQLILSVLENLSRLGFEETSRIYRGLSKALKKYLRLTDTNEKN